MKCVASCCVCAVRQYIRHYASEVFREKIFVSYPRFYADGTAVHVCCIGARRSVAEGLFVISGGPVVGRFKRNFANEWRFHLSLAL